MIKYKLGDVANVISVRVDNPASCDYKRFVGLEHYVSGDIEIKKYGDTSLLKSAMKVFKSGDILVARRNVYLRRASIVKFDGITSGDSIVLRVDNELLRNIIPFILNTDEFWNYAEKFSDGTMSKRLSPKVLLEYEFFLPEVDKQEELSKLLWAANDTKDAYMRLLFLTDELVKSQFIETFGDPISNDKGWPIELLKKVAPITAPDIKKEEFVWWLNLDMIESNSGYLIEKVIVPLSDVGSSTSTFDNTMVLYSKLRPYLNKVFIPDDEGFATTELVGMKPDVTKLNKVFLSFLLRSDHFVHFANSLSGGAQMPRMPMKALREFNCILPPLELQEGFVEMTKQAEKAKSDLKQNVINLESTIKVLMSKNFSGVV